MPDNHGNGRRTAQLAEFHARTPSLRSVTDADFAEQVLDAPDVVVVQFFARWCGPCHRAAEALEPVAAAGRTVFKLDCEVEVATAKRFCINSYPKLLLFKRGGLREIYAGERTPAAMEAWIAARAGSLRREGDGASATET